jgi:hypothetical protein
VCCAGFNAKPPTFECAPSSLIPCFGTSKVACDDATDCDADQDCCAVQDQLGTTIECKASCKGFGNQKTAVLCDPLAIPDQCAASNRTCQPSQTISGYFICKG